MAKSWPTPQDYNEAIQSPHICFSDDDLKRATVELNAMGLPRSASGTFASVYKVGTKSVSWAVRCFLSQREGQRERYKHISDFILFDDLDSTVDFHYLEEGIRVRNEWYPCLKMTWIEGDTLDQFVDKHYEDSAKMRTLLNDFHQLVGELEGAGIGHGDLQHGNIIVSPQGLRLVDYDALFVPALKGLKSFEFGHPNYQHPDRTDEHYNPDMDNFSCWLIHASLLAIAIDPELYKDLGGGDDCLLFKRKDLVAPDTSVVFQRLLAHESDNLRETARLLRRMLWVAPNEIPYLGASWEQISSLPHEKPELQAVAVSGEQNHALVALTMESRIKEANRVADLASIYEVIDASTTARKVARRRQSPFNKAYEKTFLAGRKARDRIARLADDLERTTAPFGWINRKMREARAYFFDANYDASIRLLLDVYKEIELTARGEVNLEVLTWLGYSYALNGNPALAGNYFLLALKASKETLDYHHVKHAALVLAISRFEAGNEALALKVLEDNRSYLAGLSILIQQELANIYLARASSYQLLQLYGTQLLMANEKDTLAHELLESATIVFNELVRTRSSACDEKLLDSYMTLCTSLYRAELLPQCKDSFMNLTNACHELGFAQNEKLSRFCAAVVLSGTEASDENSIDMLADFGKMSVPDLVELACSAKTFVSQGSIVRLLLSLYSTFDNLDSPSEAKEAMRATCMFATTCRAVVDDQVIVGLSKASEDTIAECLQDSYLKEGNADVADMFISKLIERRNIKVLSLVIGQLAMSGRTTQIANLCYYLAKKEELNTLRGLLQSADYYLGRGLDSDPHRALTEGLNTAIEESFERLKELESALFASDQTPIHTLNDATVEVDLLNAYKSFLRELGETENVVEVTRRLFGGDFDSVVHWWTTGVAEKGPPQKLADMALDLADDNLSRPLKRLFHSLVRQKLWSVVELIGQHLRANGKLQALLELAEELAEDGNFETFKWIAGEITGRAESPAIIELTDCLVDRLPYSKAQEYISTIVKQMLFGHRILVLSLLLNHMYDRQILSMIEPAAEEFLDTTYGASIFSELLARDGLATIGHLVRLIACRPERGLLAMNEMLRSGGVSDIKIVSMFDSTFKECINSLERTQSVVQDKDYDELSQDYPEIIVELKSVMKALLKLREFLSTNATMKKELEDRVTESLDTRFDALTILWAVALAEEHALDEMAKIVAALAKEKPDTLDQLVFTLAVAGKQKALKRIVEELIESKQPETSLSIALGLVRQHDFENFRAVSFQIIKDCDNEKTISEFISRTAQENVRLADLIVRQLGRSRQSQFLRAISIDLARSKNVVALPLVLDELLASGQLDLVNDVADVSDALGPKKVDVIASWLANLGLVQYIKARMDVLNSNGRESEAESWQKWVDEAGR